MTQEQKQVLETLKEEYRNTLTVAEFEKAKRAIERGDYVIWEGHLLLFKPRTRIPIAIYLNLFE